MEICYMPQQGHKHLSFSVTDNMSLLTYWHSNPPSDEEVFVFLYTAILSVRSALEELRAGLTHSSNSTALKQVSGRRTLAPLRKTSHEASPWCVQRTDKAQQSRLWAARGRSPLSAAQQLPFTTDAPLRAVACHSSRKFRPLAELLLATPLKHNSALHALFKDV